jgi:hypothetical protein
MMFSMVVETPFSSPALIAGDLALNAVASENPNEDDDDPRRPQFRRAGTEETAHAGIYDAPFDIELYHREGWQIRYTTSNTSAAWAGGFQFPHANSTWEPSRITGQTISRFDGGVCPMGLNWVEANQTCPGQGCTRTGPTWCCPAYQYNWEGAMGQRILSGQSGTRVPMTFATDPSVSAARQAQVTRVFTISAVAIGPAGEVSDTRTRSFVIAPSGDGGAGRLANWRSNDFLIFSVYADASRLYDWDRGIMIPGGDRQHFMGTDRALHPGSLLALNASLPLECNCSRSAAGCFGCARDGDTAYQHMLYFPPTWPNNFNRRGHIAEVPANIEIFDPSITERDGSQRVVNQRAGIRVKGGWSRGTFAYEQRTFEIYARERYGDRDNFMFPMFGESHMHDGNLMHRYRRFRLRNGGTDREQLYIRHELGDELARQAGFHNAQEFRPAVTFLNGVYYGLTFLRTPRTEDHWQRLYGGRRNAFHHIGSNERGAAGCVRTGCNRVVTHVPGGAVPVMSSRPARFGAVEPLICGMPARRATDNQSVFAMCNRADCESFWGEADNMCRDFTRNVNVNGAGNQAIPNCRATDARGIDANGNGSWDEVVRLLWGTGGRETPNGMQAAGAFQRLQQLVDIDDLVHYYAIQIFAANNDWPANNIEMWRYYPTADELERVRTGELHPHLDGRWRFIAQDLEYGWGLFQNGFVPAATHHQSNTLHALLNRTGDNHPTPGFNARPRFGAEHVEPRPRNWRAHFNATDATFVIPALLCPVFAGPTVSAEMNARFANALADLTTGALSRTNMERVTGLSGSGNTSTVSGGLLGAIENEHRWMTGGDGEVWVADPEWSSYEIRRTDRGQRRINERSRGGHNAPQADPEWGTGANGLNAWGRPSTGPGGGTAEEQNTESVTGDARNDMRTFIQGRAEFIQNTMMGLPAGRTTTPLAPNNTAGATVRSTTGDGNGLGHAFSSGRQVSASVNDGGYAQINTRILGKRGLNSADPRSPMTAQLRYFGNAPVPIMAHPWPGYRVREVVGAAPCPSGVNNRFLMNAGATTVNVVFEPDPAHNQVHISAIQARAQGTQGNWIEISNGTNRTLSTRGLYLSDNWDRIDDSEQAAPPQDREFDFRYRMPAMVIRPGQTVFFRTNNTPGDGTSNHRALKGAETNFGITFGERLRLADARGNVIQRVEVSLMTNQQMQRRGVGTEGVDDGNWRIVSWNGQRGQGITSGQIAPPPVCTGTCATCGCPTCFPPGGRCGQSACRRCNPPAGPQEIWRFGTGGMTTTGSEPQGAGFRVLGNSGVRAESSSSNDITATANGFTWNSSSSRWVHLDREDHANRPVFEQGVRYELTFTVSGTGGSVRVQNNRVNDTSLPARVELGNITSSPQTFTHTWTQGAAGNLAIGINQSSSANNTTTISNIIIRSL